MKWRFWKRKQLRERDLDEEIRAHLAIETRARRETGESEEDARAHALRDFGNPALVREVTRDVWGRQWLDTLVKDIRYAVRLLARSPAYTSVALLTIVLTVGGVSTVFTLVHSVLLRPLPYPESERLVLIEETNTIIAQARGLSDFTFLTLAREARSFDGVAAYSTGSVATLDPDTSPYQVRISSITPELFPLLGIEPILGPGLRADDTAGGGSRTAVISHGFWRTRLNGREDVIGEHVPISLGFGPDRDFEIVVAGVMPEGLGLPFFTGNSTFPGIWTLEDLSEEPPNRPGSLTVLARLRPGADLPAAQAELDTISERLRRDHPGAYEGRMTSGTRLIDSVVGNTARILWIFFGAVACVLLIGVANLTSLQVARSAARDHEIHVRAALGAGRGRLVLQFLTEALTLGLAGGALGVLAAWGGVRLVLWTMPSQFPRLGEIGLDGTIVLVSLAIALAAGIVLGLVPGLQASSRVRPRAIQEGGRNATLGARRGRLQRCLIGIETASALVLLVGAALLGNSLWRLFTEDAGMNEDNLLTARVSLPLTYRQSDAAQELFWRAATETVRALPQVEIASAVAGNPPLSGLDIRRGGVLPAGSTLDPMRDGFSLSHRSILSDYFRAVGIPVIRGRAIDETDVSGSEPVAVLNELAARLLWPGEDALGKRIASFGELTVIGIVPDFKHYRLDGEIEPQMYTAHLQGNPGGTGTGGTIMVRTRTGASGVPTAIETAISDIEARAEVTIATMAGLRWDLVAEERLRTGVLLIFALAAGFLALVGVFGVVAYSVVQRKREIGVRIAVGAENLDVVRLMLKQAMWPVVIGLGIGLAAALGLTRLLSSFLFEVEPNDPLTITASVLGLLSAALAASLIPARKAARVDPMTVLKQD